MKNNLLLDDIIETKMAMEKELQEKLNFFSKDTGLIVKAISVSATITECLNGNKNIFYNPVLEIEIP